MNTKKGRGQAFRQLATILDEWVRQEIISIPGYYLMMVALDEALFGEELAGPVFINGATLEKIQYITRRHMQRREALIARYIKYS